jgi:hypothetical protein
VTHVRKEAGLRLVGALKLLRLLVQLGVERNYATVGIFKLGVQSGQFLLPHV